VSNKAKRGGGAPFDASSTSDHDSPLGQESEPGWSPKPLHDISAIARRLRLSEKTVRRLIASKKLRAYRIGRQFRISEEDYIRFLDARR
jgi:excisionase family DNA binding protein